MKFLLLSICFVALMVRWTAGEEDCDMSKLQGCVQQMTNSLSKDATMAQSKDKMCGLLQSYVDCIFQDVCHGKSLTDGIKEQITQSQTQYGFDCDLNLESGSGKVSPYFVTIFLTVIGFFFAF